MLTESPYFARLLTSPFREAHLAHLDLDEAPENVIAVLLWLHKGTDYDSLMLKDRGRALRNRLIEQAQQNLILARPSNSTIRNNTAPVAHEQAAVIKSEISEEVTYTNWSGRSAAIEWLLDIARVATYMQLDGLAEWAQEKVKKPITDAHSANHLCNLLNDAFISSPPDSTFRRFLITTCQKLYNEKIGGVRYLALIDMYEPTVAWMKRAADAEREDLNKEKSAVITDLHKDLVARNRDIVKLKQELKIVRRELTVSDGKLKQKKDGLSKIENLFNEESATCPNRFCLENASRAQRLDQPYNHDDAECCYAVREQVLEILNEVMDME